MINFDNVIKENIKEQNPNWAEFPGYPYRIIIQIGQKFQAIHTEY